MLRKAIADERGRILVWALVILGIGALLLPVFLSHASTNLFATRAIEKGLKEQYAADAGVEKALWYMQNGGELPEGEEILAPPILQDFAVNNRTVSVRIEKEAEEVYKITSTATSADGSSTKVVSHVKFVIIIPSVFDHAAVALGSDERECDIDLGGSFETGSSIEVRGGDIYANGNICLSGSAEVDGDAAATGTISCPTEDCDEILGEKVENAPTISAPDLDITALLTEAEAGGMYIGDWSTNHSTTLGPLHITGNLSIEGNATVTLEGTVYVDGIITMQGTSEILGGYTIVAEGDITLRGNGKIDPANFPYVISTGGNITITGNNYTSAVVYAPNGDVTLTGNAMLYGAAVGKSVTGTGNGEIDYPSGLTEIRGLSGGTVGLQITTYRIYP